MFTSPQVVEAIRCLVDTTYQFVCAQFGIPLLGMLRSSEPITLIVQSQIVDGQHLLQSLNLSPCAYAALKVKASKQTWLHKTRDETDTKCIGLLVPQKKEPYSACQIEGCLNPKA